MTSRPRLITSIPFWILLVGSVVVGALGLWIVLDRLGVMERGLEDGTATTAQVYGGQSWAIVGAILLGAGIVGIALALAVAAARSFVPSREVDVVETIDWTSDEDTAEETFAPATTASASHTAPVASAPVIAEDPDVEVPSSTPAPAAAAHEAPALQTEVAPTEDDKRV